MENSTKYRELLDTMNMIGSDEFQKFIVKPLKEYRFNQKNNFFSDSLKDQWRKGGRVEAINEFFKLLKQIDNDYKNELFELKKSEEGE